MSNIEKIRQEIEKWIYNTDEWEVSPGKYNKSESEVYKLGWRCGLGYIREFIDSLPEEKPSEDLEEAAKTNTDELWRLCSWQPNWDDLYESFIAGAEWQKEQMMNEWLKDRDGCFWDGVEEGKKAMEEQMTKDSEEDALLIERAWLTLDGFGHEELAERLRQFAERKGLIWK